MKIVLTGGGSSAGHITPNLAVAHQLKALDPNIETIYIGHRGDKLGDIAATGHGAIDKFYTVRAGKLRRFHGVGIKQVLDISTTAKNIRDVWWVIVGFFQSLLLLKKQKPDCVFVKGSYVGAVVGLAAALLRIPYVTHDSDAIPGLGNRIVARWAKAHAVALSKEIYPYPQDKTVTVGVPVQAEFVNVTPDLQASYKKELGFAQNEHVLFVTGGGQGAQRLNDAMIKIVADLFKDVTALRIVHLAGHVNEDEVRSAYQNVLKSDQIQHVLVMGYARDLYRYSGAADLIVTRAGATTMAEFAVQHKACVMIPNPYLTGGQQLKNATFLNEKNAIRYVTEDDMQNKPSELAKAVVGLFKNDVERHELEKNLGTFAHPDAAKELAMLLLEQTKR